MSLPGRNDPCHCGSGKKYKKCCLPEDREEGQVKGTSPHSVGASGSPTLETRSLRADAPSSGPSLEGKAATRRDEVLDLLTERGILPLSFELQDRLHVSFQSACQERWREDASDSPRLVQAREEIEEVVSERRFEKRGGRKAYEERREAAVEPLEVLEDGGQRGLPHLGVLLHSSSWASGLAIGTIVDAEPSRLRDRLIVEALFSPGDWIPDHALRHVDVIPPEDRLEAFWSVAGHASDAGIELQGGFWTGLFEDEPSTLEEPVRPLPDFGPALEVLHDEGHLGALARGVEALLDPSFSGPESVRAFLDDGGFRGAIEHIRSTETPDRLALEGRAKHA